MSFPPEHAAQLEPYLPPSPTSTSTSTTTTTTTRRDRPFVTLTYAQSLDGQIAAAPGTRTTLSGAASKAMTHHLRSRHDAILVGVGTAAADDPGLNCRLLLSPRRHDAAAVVRHPRPVVLDPRARWDVSEGSKVVRLARGGQGLGPWVLCAEGAVVDEGRRRVVEGVGGAYLRVPTRGHGGDGGGGFALAWDDVLRTLRAAGVESVMVEGGARVLDDLLALASAGEVVVDAVVVTIAPCWLGRGGVRVAPGGPVEGAAVLNPGPRLEGVRWVQMGEDMVLCGRVSRRGG